MRFFTGRPVLASILFLAVLLLGFYSLRHSPIELLPDERLPALTINGSWMGASADLVMQRMALPIEEMAMKVRGVSKIRSQCREGGAEIEVEFNRGTDMEFVTVLLKEQINRLRDKLPPAVPLPEIVPFRPREFESRPLLEISVYGAESIYTVRNAVDREFVPRLRGIDGIKYVEVVGGVDAAVKISTDQRRLDLFGIDISTIIVRLRRNFFNLASVTSFRSGRELIISLTHPASGPAEIAETVIARYGDRPVLLKDVATVAMGYKEITSEGRYQGLPTVNLTVRKQPRAPTVKLAEKIKAKLEEARRRSRVNLQYRITVDESKDLRERLFKLDFREGVFGLLPISGLILVIIFVILLFFARDAKAALLIFSSVFFSVFTTFTVIYIFDIPLNLLTLSGFALGFGMFVDNAVVVFDNIMRLQEKGISRIEAAIEGPRQVFVPILASTLTTIVVFFSFAYFQGRLRVYYLPVAVTVSVALAASVLVAFSLIPPLAARMRFRFKLMKSKGVGAVYRPLLRYPLFTLLPVCGLLAFSFLTFKKNVSFGRFFSFYQSQYLSVFLRLPPGSQFEDAKAAILNFEKIAVAKPYEKEVVTWIQNSIAYMRITFPRRIEFSPHPYELKQELIAQAANLAGVTVSVQGFDPDGYAYNADLGSYLPYRIQIKGYDYDRLLGLAGELKQTLLLHRKINEVAITTDRSFFRTGSKYFHLGLDYARLSKLGINPAYLLYLVRSSMRTDQSDRIRLADKEYDLEIRLQGAETLEMDALFAKQYHSPAGVPFRLGDVMRLEEREAKGGISRENQEYVAVVSWDYLGSTKAADRVFRMIYNNLRLPPGFKKSEEERLWLIQEEEQKQLDTAIALALFLILLILVVLYNSLWQALLIMLAIPLALIGVFLAFVVGEYSFDSTAYVGLILLFGLVVNNSIILVDHINLYVRRGLPLREAIAMGAYERIRPVFMTTATTVFGALPMVLFKQGEQADIWSTLALCIVGGLTASSILILVVIPVFYLLFWGLRQHWQAGAASLSRETERGIPSASE